jgi:site-specific DNA-methyltransferase (adenine-specific)
LADNVLYYGDNLEVLRLYVKDESVDLIYLDPPFKSNQNYNVLFTEQNGSKSKAQIRAFRDTWQWDQGAAESYQEIVENGPERVSRVMQAFWTFLGGNDVMAYLAMMGPRLVELYRVLKPTGSIYLHCDPSASHYLKLLMDAIFDGKNFRNEIVWHYGQRTAFHRRHFSRKHDIILFYAKSSAASVNPIADAPPPGGTKAPKKQSSLSW